MAQSVGDLIRSAMRKIGVLAAGEPLPPEDGDDARIVFAQMVDSWSLESLLIPVVSVVTKTLVVGEPQYTIGVYPTTPIPDNHIETARPEQILSSFIRDGSGTDYTQTFENVKSFSRISRKSNLARPSKFYLRKGWPSNSILFESAPYEADTLHLEVIQPLSEYISTASLTTEINLPPGYEQVLIYNLAVMLSDEWGKQVSNAVATLAVDGKKKIKRNNYRQLTLTLDRALTANRMNSGTFDIYSGV